MATLDDEDIEKISNSVLNMMEIRRNIPEDKHTAQHNYLELLMDMEKQRARRNEKIKTQVIGWGVVSFLFGIGTVGYTWFENLVRAISRSNGGG